MTRVAIVSGQFHPMYGGPWSVVEAHYRALRPLVDVTVFGVAPKAELEFVRGLEPDALVCPLAWPRRWFRGNGLASLLAADATRFDVFHAHMLWDHAVWATARAARRARKPLVITPHGAISDPWRMRGIHKRLYRRLVLNRILGGAVAIHALNDHEEARLRAWGVDAPIEVIPNGLPRAAYDAVHDPALAERRWPRLREGRRFLFLGRLAREKGLELLVEAWACAALPRDHQLVIAGPDYRGFERILRARIDSLGLGERVWLTGSVSGELKGSLLASADVFVLPSLGEGFSVALLEAMAAALPALYTTECHFAELAEQGGGWVVAPTRDELAAALTAIAKLEPATVAAKGQAGRTLGRAQYALESVAAKLVRLYSSLSSQVV